MITLTLIYLYRRYLLKIKKKPQPVTSTVLA
jgi:hypothetical protein